MDNVKILIEDEDDSVTIDMSTIVEFDVTVNGNGASGEIVIENDSQFYGSFFSVKMGEELDIIDLSGSVNGLAVFYEIIKDFSNPFHNLVKIKIHSFSEALEKIYYIPSFIKQRLKDGFSSSSIDNDGVLTIFSNSQEGILTAILDDWSDSNLIFTYTTVKAFAESVEPTSMYNSSYRVNGYEAQTLHSILSDLDLLERLSFKYLSRDSIDIVHKSSISNSEFSFNESDDSIANITYSLSDTRVGSGVSIVSGSSTSGADSIFIPTVDSLYGMISSSKTIERAESSAFLKMSVQKDESESNQLSFNYYGDQTLNLGDKLTITFLDNEFVGDIVQIDYSGVEVEVTIGGGSAKISPEKSLIIDPIKQASNNSQKNAKARRLPTGLRQ